MVCVVQPYQFLEVTRFVWNVVKIMDNQKKDVGKALGTNDIRALAPNWTLAGDVGLLAHLEQFSEVL